MTCAQCGRSEFYDVNGRRSTRVNREGLCPNCANVHAEATVDLEEKVDTARRRLARMRDRSDALGRVH